MSYPLNIIGESINASIPAVKEAVIAHDKEKITALAIRQAECGAHMLDVNAAVVGRNEPEDLVWMVQAVQSVVDLPLVMDSSDPNALREALKVYQGPDPILSSITGEMTEGHESLLSLAVEHNCGLVAMCMDEEGISPDAAKRLAVAERLVERSTKAGLKPENLYVDPLVMAVSADTMAGATFLDLLHMIRMRLPEVHTFCGASNVSHGMPLRKLFNHTFVSMLVACGMDSFLVNVRDQGLMATFLASASLIGQDEWSMEYIRAFRAGKLDIKK
jgi:5-methyltetrahydrofolate--homocysteine methyltransferase